MFYLRLILRQWILFGSTIALVSFSPMRSFPAMLDKNTKNNNGFITCSAGELYIGFFVSSNGIKIMYLTDQKSRTMFISKPTPLFSLVFRQMDSTNKTEHFLSSTNGWQKVSISKTTGGFEFNFSDPSEPLLSDIGVKISLKVGRSDSSLRWKLGIINRSRIQALRSVTFPYVNLAKLSNGIVLFPRGPGEIQQGVWNGDFHYHGNYPGGWCSMQFVAAYTGEQNPSGLYIGYHDSFGATKDIDIRSIPVDKEERILKVVFETPAPNIDKPGNNFSLNGEVVWKLFRGDWLDAAKIYRDWVVREAKWFPRVEKYENGLRKDTPEWMRNLDVWVMTGGSPNDCAQKVMEFRKLVDAPIGFHWYNWHQIPFDNDYPHYFPSKTNFIETVAELQRNGIYVMPYINGRLWDTRDNGTNDWQFSTVAFPAATKREDGKPFVESYGSKEINGEPVRLAVMCPTVKLWQNKVKEIVLNLLKTNETRAVYIDQIAAAPPVLCVDRNHNHPSGGGHWWNEGYWQMLENIRREKPKYCALTTECNGEPFIRWLDGYLTWHWQYCGQVPAFSAVYGGAIQMFGRAYRGGDTKDLAFRMKAAQQLVFGEQIGWFEPDIASQPQNLAFLKKLIKTRSMIRPFFIGGEMCRPPLLEGEIPSVKADWQWSGEWWVTTSAVLTGTWRFKREVVIIFANVSDQTVKANFHLGRGDFGLKSKSITIEIIEDGERSVQRRTSLPLKEGIEILPRSVQAWRIR